MDRDAAVVSPFAPSCVCVCVSASVCLCMCVCGAVESLLHICSLNLASPLLAAQKTRSPGPAQTARLAISGKALNAALNTPAAFPKPSQLYAS